MAGTSLVRHPEEVPLQPVSPDDTASVAALVEIRNAAQRIDDPEGCEWVPGAAADDLRYGWDLQPEEHFLYRADGAEQPVAALAVDMPKRDNLHLFWMQLLVHPEHRRQGHGTAVMTEALQLARQAGRSTIWAESLATPWRTANSIPSPACDVAGGVHSASLLDHGANEPSSGGPDAGTHNAIGAPLGDG